MEFQQPNFLYCLCNELHEVDAATSLGKTHRMIDNHAVRTVTTSVQDPKWKTSEKRLFCIFNYGRETYRYMHIFRNVTERDLTYMRLAYGFQRMYLIDEPAKAMLIANVAESVNLEVQCNRHLEEEDVHELQIASLTKIAFCEVT